MDQWRYTRADEQVQYSLDPFVHINYTLLIFRGLMLAAGATYKSDRELASSLKAGKRDAFKRLYARFAPMIMGIITRSVPDEKMAEKLLQETFIAIWQNRNSAMAQPIVAWLLGITRGVLAGHRKKLSGMPVENAHTDETRVLEMAWHDGWNVDDLSLHLGADKEQIKTLLRNAVNKFKSIPND